MRSTIWLGGRPDAAAARREPDQADAGVGGGGTALGVPAEFERLVHPDARFVERPCLVSPRGQERDPAGAWAGLVHGRELLRAQRIEVRDHLVAGDRVVTRAVWTGTLAQPAGPLPAGAELRADCSMFFTVRDGRILAQENFDCYHPPRGLTFAYRRY